MLKLKIYLRTSVYSLSNGFFSINGLWIPGSVLLFKKRFFMWGVTDAHEIKEHTLDMLKIIKPRPSK
jgi:NADH dehydrogenase [ubiquinone] 1 alpha subcomplex assembly factor 3